MAGHLSSCGKALIDIILATEASKCQISLIMEVLNHFCHASGQKISLSNSSLFVSLNVDSSLVIRLEQISGIRATEDFGSDLGMPILQGKISKACSHGLLDKGRAKLAGWKSKTLSMGVGLRSRARSDTICLPKSKGGLGVRPTVDVNLAITGKLGWKILTRTAGEIGSSKQNSHRTLLRFGGVFVRHSRRAFSKEDSWLDDGPLLAKAVGPIEGALLNRLRPYPCDLPNEGQEVDSSMGYGVLGGSLLMLRSRRTPYLQWFCGGCGDGGTIGDEQALCWFVPESAMISPTSILSTKPFSFLKNTYNNHENNFDRKHHGVKFDPKGVGLSIAVHLFSDENEYQIDPSDSKKRPGYTNLVLFGSQLKTKNSNCAVIESPSSGLDSPDSPWISNGCLSATEMALSEDYTCVIARGEAVTKTTRIFEDCIVDSCLGETEFLRNEG
ncbi:hypothetical protein V2J09_011446 [Rumex salicifolius]